MTEYIERYYFENKTGMRLKVYMALVKVGCKRHEPGVYSFSGRGDVTDINVHFEGEIYVVEARGHSKLPDKFSRVFQNLKLRSELEELAEEAVGAITADDIAKFSPEEQALIKKNQYRSSMP